MPPIPPPPLPRVVVYYQTHHEPSGKPISILPLINEQGISATHVVLAAIHINDDPQGLTLNDEPPSHHRYELLWAEVAQLQKAGIKVLGMLGGAAKGSYQRLDQSEAQFEIYYGPLRDLIRERHLDGLDLDVEEPMSFGGIVRLIDRIRQDFGKQFIITMAPVAAALLNPRNNLSGFDYESLEVMRGGDISWYNAQFYCGWGDIRTTLMYDMMMQKGWPPEKVVVGVVTSPENGRGFVPAETLRHTLLALNARYECFGGVMGWEYFNSVPGGRVWPWHWAKDMTALLRGSYPVVDGSQESEKLESQEIDADEPGQKAVEVPAHFEYYSDYSDGIDDD